MEQFGCWIVNYYNIDMSINTKYIDVAKFVIFLIGIILSIGICYATLNQKVVSLETEETLNVVSHNKIESSVVTISEKFQLDHEKLIIMASDIKYIKEDVKDIKNYLINRERLTTYNGSTASR